MRAANVGIYLRLYKRLTVFSWQALKILVKFAVICFSKEKSIRIHVLAISNCAASETK